MSLEASYRKYLVSLPAVAALVGERVSPLKSKKYQGQPRIEYEQLSGANLGDLSGPSGVNRALYQVSCWGADYQGAKALAAAITGSEDEPALDGFQGWMGGTGEDDGGTWIQMARVEESSDDEQPPIDGSDEGLSRVILDALIISNS